MFALVELNPAHPELGNLADDGPAVVLQPDLIAARQIVLPLRDRDIGIDMNLPEHAIGEIRRVIDACLRVGFPRIHRAFHFILLRPLARRLHRAVAEHHNRLGPFRVQQQQGRKYPGIAIPECVASIIRC